MATPTQLPGDIDQRLLLVPTLRRGNAALGAPAPRLAGFVALERLGLHSHAGAWERDMTITVQLPDDIDQRLLLVPTLRRGNAALGAPAPRLAGAGTLERPGLHSHAGAWERG